MRNRPLVLVLAVAGFLASPVSAAPARVVADTDTVRVPGNVSPRISGAVEVGPTDGTLPVERMTLVLRSPAGVSDRRERLLAEQLDPSSPNYHRWLTPEEYGREFGIADEDLNAVLDWLQRNGFAIDKVAPGRGWINFSGTVAQVETTFRTEMRDFVAGGRLHHANVRDPEVPRGLQDVVWGVVSLHDFFKLSRPRSRPSIVFSDGTNGLGPADFATIYNTAPLLAAGVDGRGQTIAVVSRSNIQIADVQNFRSYFGLPALDPVITLNGPDPGLVKDDESEADLDVQWAGAVAPGATVNLVVSKDTLTSDGIDLSAQYIVDNNLASIMTLSYGLCESDLGASGRHFYNALWQQAAAQGMTVFVASGDSGVSDCDDPSSKSGSGRAVNGLSSTPYNVSVGGTEFVDASSSQYWSTQNAPGTHRSVKSYIPEQAWNESAAVSGGSELWATGGGPSAYYAKPSWQSAPGVPGDGFRDVPDVSLNAASNVGYVFFQEYDPGVGSFWVSSGTSFAAPSFAGIMALVLQKAGGRQGNPNPVFYRLGAAQYSGGGPAVFHDVTAGDNGVPGVAGFSAGPGYDLATGLGSVDATALVSSFPAISGPSADFTFFSATPKAGQRVQFTDTSTGFPTSWSWDFGDGGTSSVQNPAHTFSKGTYQVSLTASNGGGSNTRTQTVVVSWGNPIVCAPNAFTMCLVNGRYKVTSHWKNQYAGGAEANLPVAALTDATGAFWILDPADYEYLIRINTATDNGKAWIAIPTFTDVEFWIAVFDVVAGQYKEYHSPAGNRTLIYDPYFFVFP